jgi:hypothetical protein
MKSQQTLRERIYIIRAAFALMAMLLLGSTFTAFAEVNAEPECNLIISEFRVRGPNGANDEFVEIYNNSGAAHKVKTTDGSAGYAVAASDGMTRFIIPNNTVIPGRGHYLGVNAVGYSLAAYPAGNNGKTATGDKTYTTDIPDNFGIALFRTANPGNFTLANRLDAVGTDTEANALYREGTGYLHLTPFSIDYSFYRDLSNGFPKDTNNNAADLVFVDSNGTSAGAGQRLGVAGPENLSSPVRRKGRQAVSRVDPEACLGCEANRVRDFTSDPANNSTFGTISVQRTFTNNTNSKITRLRFRVTDITTFPSPSGIADLRPRTSSAVVVSLSSGGTATVKGTILEQPPSQPNGGGFNSSFLVDSVTPAAPIQPGATIKVRFLFGIQQTGKYRIALNAEALPFSGQAIYAITGSTDSTGDREMKTGGDYDNDVVTDLAVWKPTTGAWTVVNSAGGQNTQQVFGQIGDVPAPGDYDGDGEVDLAVFRPSNKTFYILRSSDNTTVSKQWGLGTDIPVPADYDGDGLTDIATYRSSNSTFFVFQSSTNSGKAKKVGATNNLPVVGDYDDDGKADFAIFQPVTKVWRIIKSSNNMTVNVTFGLATDIPVVGDYDKDGRDDISMWRPSNGHWYVLRSSNDTLLDVQFGANGDVPQAGDYDGDGKTDFVVFRPSNSTFYLLKSTEGSSFRKLGQNGDVPVSAAVLVP